MIITVTLNPSIDKTLKIDNFTVNSVFRAEIVGQNPGGKGINVSRAVKKLTGLTTALLLIGGPEGKEIVDKLKKEGIDYHSVDVSGQSRTCYGIIDPLRKTETVINEPGPFVSEEPLSRFISLYDETIRSDDLVALSGSAPLGIRKDIYYDLITIAKRKKAYTVVDTSGDYLHKAIEAIPDIIKINRRELENLFHCSLSTYEDIIDKSRVLLQKGIARVIVTQGKNTALALTHDYVYTVTPPSVNAINTWGCGDSFVAGLCYILDREKADSFEKALAWAAAASAHNTLSFGAGFINRDEVVKLIEKVQIEMW
jgi:tagatose 6-phosphate kinase